MSNNSQTKKRTITKKNFVNYFTWQKSWWFKTVTELKKKFIFDEVEEDEDSTFDLDNDLEEFWNNFSIEESNPKDPNLYQAIELKKIFKEKLINEFNYRYVEIKPMDSLEQKFHATKNACEVEPTLIFNAVFFKDDVVVNLDAAIVEGNEITIIDFKLSTRTKPTDAIFAYFNYHALMKMGYIVKDYYICLIAYQRALRNECPLILSQHVRLSHTCSIAKSIKEMIDEEEKMLAIQELKSGKTDGIKIMELLTAPSLIDIERTKALKMIEFFHTLNFNQIVSELKKFEEEEPRIDDYDLYCFGQPQKRIF